MRTILGMQIHLDRWRSLGVAVLVGAGGLVMAACQSEAPTGVPSGGSGGSAAQTFPMTPGAAHAALTSTNQLIRTLPTIQAMSAEQGNVSSAGAVTNSPWDMTYFGGPVITQATSWNLYVNCSAGPASCWGTGGLTPATYLRDLNESSLIQVAGQYLGERPAGHFHVTELQTTATFTANTAQLSDIFSILASAVSFTNAAGYTNLYHVFLPQGTDMCISAGECYSPDNPSTFQFCAFHGSVNFGTTHVVYTVEPYEAVPGCSLPTQTRVIDATASALSHEFFESISDPDLDAWFNALTGNEMSDECFGFRFADQVGSHSYVVQEEYSNAIQDCTNGAS